MPTLLLIRHGENDYLAKNKLPGRIPGIPLNERGREQAEALAQSLHPLHIQTIYASPLERAIETAGALAKNKDLKIRIIPDLTDTDVGEWEGRSWKALGRLKEWKVVQENPSNFRFPGGESFPEIQARVVFALDAITNAQKKDEVVAVVFHADPIKLAIAHYLGLGLDNFQRLSISTGSVTILKFDRGSARLLGLNLIPPFSLPKL